MIHVQYELYEGTSVFDNFQKTKIKDSPILTLKLELQFEWF